MNLCEKHIGEAFPPRCAACDLETLQTANAVVRARLDRNPPDVIRALRDRAEKSRIVRDLRDPVPADGQLALDFANDTTEAN